MYIFSQFHSSYHHHRNYSCHSCNMFTSERYKYMIMTHLYSSLYCSKVMFMFQGCASVSLADFDAKEVSVRWYNVLSFKFMQSEATVPSKKSSSSSDSSVLAQNRRPDSLFKTESSQQVCYNQLSFTFELCLLSLRYGRIMKSCLWINFSCFSVKMDVHVRCCHGDI